MLTNPKTAFLETFSLRNIASICFSENKQVKALCCSLFLALLHQNDVCGGLSKTAPSSNSIPDSLSLFPPLLLFCRSSERKNVISLREYWQRARLQV